MSSEDYVVTDSSLWADGDDDAFSFNAIIPVRGPYPTAWHYSTSALWSRNLIERGEFEAIDALLLAFTVDVGMKLYIANDMDFSVLHIQDDSALVWTILNKVRSSVHDQVRLHGWSRSETMASVEYFFLTVAADFGRIRQRFEIGFLQHIQDPYFRQILTEEITMFRSFSHNNNLVRRVFRWVYGERPESACVKKIRDEQGNLLRNPITIRQWVFEYN